jgi:hypothetical protein
MLDAYENNADHLIKPGMIVLIVAQHSLDRGIILGDRGTITYIDTHEVNGLPYPLFHVWLNDTRHIIVSSNMIVEDDEALSKDEP